MFIEMTLAIVMVLLIFAISIISLIGWIVEGFRREETEKRIRQLEFYNHKLNKELIYHRCRSNVTVADDYYKGDLNVE